MMLPGRAKIFVANAPVDFRKSYDGLCGIVRDVLGEDPQSAAIFVFRNRRRDQIRILWWDRNGFAIWMKRMERETFRFPRSEKEKVVITPTDLAMLLEGAVALRRAA